MKRVLILVFSIVILGIFGIYSFSKKVEISDDFPEIVATNFVGYDFARALAPEGVKVEMLLRPGAEAHGFEPSPADIKKLEKAKLIIMNGGESEEWVERLFEANTDLGKKSFRMMSFVDLVEEGESLSSEGHGHEEHELEGHEEHEDGGDESDKHEIDEHIWTSPVNVIKILAQLETRLGEIYPEESEKISWRAEGYSSEFNQIDLELREIVNNSERKKIVVGDRFPFIYLVREYGLEYLAAFPGCAESTDVNPQALSELIQVVRAEDIPVVYKIEMSNGAVAEAVASETGARLLELQSGHNVSDEDFRAGVKYVDLVRRNLEMLREGLK